jgi:hypothetical protein
VNDSLKKRPAENAEIRGFVMDETTMDPVADAMMDLDWRDTEGNRIEYHATSDSTGFYSCQLPAGEIYIDVRADDYREEELGRNDAYADETSYVNITMRPDIPQVDMVKPLNAIYLYGNRIIPYERCIVMGSIDIEAFIHDFWYRSEEDRVEHVEFYIDDELKQTVEQAPFSWTWDDMSFGQHTITITIVDDEGHHVSCERMVTKYL